VKNDVLTAAEKAVEVEVKAKRQGTYTGEEKPGKAPNSGMITFT
jgi:hypothetical protein